MYTRTCTILPPACQTDLARPRRCADPGGSVAADSPGNPPIRRVVCLPRAARGHPPSRGDTGCHGPGRRRAGRFVQLRNAWLRVGGDQSHRVQHSNIPKLNINECGIANGFVNKARRSHVELIQLKSSIKFEQITFSRDSSRNLNGFWLFLSKSTFWQRFRIRAASQQLVNK